MIVKEKLSNGLTLVTESMPHVRSVAMGVWLKRGSRHEPESLSGISHFIEHMVFKGTKTRKAAEIAAAVDSMGGQMDAFTAKEYACFHVKVLSECLPRAIEILADITLNPLFDPAETAKEKKVIHEEINMVEDTPDDLVVELYTTALWPDHPLGRSILGTKRSVSRIKSGDLKDFFRSTYQAGHVLVAVAGHVEHAEVSRLVHLWFAELSARPDGDLSSPPNAASRIISRSKKELEQVHLCLGLPAYPQAHPRRYATYILNAVLGGSLSSRLFQNIREKRGLAYAISSGIAAYSDAGTLSVYAGTSLESADEVLALTLDEFRRLADETVGDEELRRAKDHLKGSIMLSLESTGARMSQLARHEIYFERQFSLDELLDGIESVGAEEVRSTAADLFSRQPTLSMLGNLGGFRPRLDRPRT
ncbi:MAG: insulinase family protein [Vicinamibacteria bacterium]|nr:insulinase family protein [Vicinamibacteria bacterium]